MGNYLTAPRTVPAAQTLVSPSDPPTNPTAMITAEHTPIRSFPNAPVSSESPTNATTATANTPTAPAPPSLPSPSNQQYTVFISHAGEDKATIAIPLREKLMAQGITAFVDEVDMPPGTEARTAMTNAMETTRVAVIILSPEFVARKWPMRELMYFLRRREEGCAHQRNAPIIIPCFYRIKLGELYDEPRLDRTDEDSRLLYRESRFHARQANGEPEANIARIKAALSEVHGIMGVRNDVDASNDPAYVMSRRREVLLNELCDKVRLAVPPWTVKKGTKRKAERTESDEFYAHFDIPHETSELIFDFDSKDDDGKSSTQEGRLLERLLNHSEDVNRAIAVRGIGGVGKTSLLRGISRLKRVKERFIDGIYNLSLGVDSTRRITIKALSKAVENSGGQEMADVMRSEIDFVKVMSVFRSWFANKRCLFVVDDVWETEDMSSNIIHELLTLHISGRDSKVLLTTRSMTIASRADTCCALEPRDAVGSESRAILVGYSGIKPEHNEEDDNKVVDDILYRCSGLPLFLAVAGKSVKALSFRRGHRGCVAYHVYGESLKTSMETLVRTNVDSYERLSARLMISVKLLEER